MAEIDPSAIGNIFGNIKTVADYNNANQNFQLQRLLAGQQIQTGALDAATKQNVLTAQVLGAAQDQPTYTAALQKLNGVGVDTSQFAPDFVTGQGQVQAALRAQSPLGTLLNAATKLDANNNTAAIAGGNVPGNPNAIATAVLTNGANSIVPGAGALLPRPAAAAGVPIPGTTAPAAAATPSAAPVDAGNTTAGQNLPPVVPLDANAVFAQGAGPQTTPAQAAAPAPAATTAAALPAAPPFNPPAPDPTKTQAANQAAYQQALETYKADPRTVAATSAAGALGTEQVKDSQNAASSQAFYGKLQANIDALRKLNASTPSDAFVPAEAQGWLSNNLAGIGIGKGDAANAISQWNQIGVQQTLNQYQQLVAGGQIRSNKALLNLLTQAAEAPIGLNQTGRGALLNSLEAELNNTKIGAQNVAAASSGGAQQPYQALPVTLPQNGQTTAPAIQNGMTATGPGGKRIIFMDGAWKDLN